MIDPTGHRAEPYSHSMMASGMKSGLPGDIHPWLDKPTVVPEPAPTPTTTPAPTPESMAPRIPDDMPDIQKAKDDYYSDFLTNILQITMDVHMIM